MKKIWLVWIFLLNLTPNISNGTFTLTGMNKVFAQLGVNEFICEDEYGDVFDSSLPCDELPCVSTCQTCGEQGICEDDHICPDVECETCGEFYPAGDFHVCTPIRCSLCDQDYYPVIGHSCSGESEDNGGDTPVEPPYTPPSTPVNPSTPLEQAKITLKKYINNLELNNEDIIYLGNIFNNLEKQIGYNILLNFIKNYPISKISISSNVLVGGYNPMNNSISFNSSQTIDNAITEEFLHHVQNILYQDGISQYDKINGGLSQIEFETKVLQDILCTINSGYCGWYGDTASGSTDYGQWIYDICSNNEFPNNDKLFGTNNITGKNYNHFLHLFNNDPNRSNYHSPIIDDLRPKLFDFIYSNL